MSPANPTSKRSSELSVGDELPEFALNVTSAVIVAGAVASRDFMPAHHDPEYAKGQGAPDVFMNILTTNALVSRYVTDWAGPGAVIQNVSIRLGTPNTPGDTMTFRGSVVEVDDDSATLEIKGSNAWGDHVTGRVRLALPL